MNIINDNVFGEMRYEYSWEKDEKLTAFGSEKTIKIVAEAYTGQGILDIQRDNYKKYKEQLNCVLPKIPGILLKYYQDNYDIIASYIDIPEKINKENINEQLIVKLVRIKTLYFARNGRYGWLCDCAWDEENGISIVLSDKEPIVKEQDYLI